MVIRVTTSNRGQEASDTSYSPSPYRLFDRMFENMFNEWAVRTQSRPGTTEGWHPPVDVFEKEGNLVIQADIPGVDEKSIDLKLEGNVLTIKGERKFNGETKATDYYQVEGSYGPFSRSFRLPDGADNDKISAAYKNGVLSVTIPAKAEVQPRSIKVSS